VLSPEEVARLLDAAPSLKYKAALSVAHGAGLRASEIISLKVEYIDSTRMVTRVEQGKSLPLRRHCEGRGPQGSIRDALAVSPRLTASPVEGGAAPGLAVSRARSGAAADDAAAQPRLRSASP
jgi:integrase